MMTMKIIASALYNEYVKVCPLKWLGIRTFNKLVEIDMKKYVDGGGKIKYEEV